MKPLPASANPIANAGQLAAEEEVRGMWALPQTKAARDQAAQLWRIAHGTDVPDAMQSRFDEAMDGWVSNYLFKAAATDAAAPRFVRNFMPGYRWHGADVPDARMGGDNPDNCYRLTAIVPGARYRVNGRILDRQPAHVSFTLVENWGTSITVQTLELPGILIDDDGGFTITIDGEAAAGRPNHMTSSARTKFLFVRDTMLDWACETPLALEIERLDKPPVLCGPEQRLDEALRRMLEDVPLYYWFFRLSAGKPVNSMAAPVAVAGFGGLVTQASSLGRLNLAEDQAAVVRFDPAGARYCSFQMASWWYRSIDAHRRQSGLTAAQAEANADGTVTLVVSTRDPGFANWVDSAGLEDLLPMIRWQGLPRDNGQQGPRLWLDIVSWPEIDRHLPVTATRLDAAQRALRLAGRQRDWDRRTSP